MNPERTYYQNGQIETEEWKNEDGELHRIDGPAAREWYDDGQLEREVWYINGTPHRLDGPAVRYWYDDGQLASKSWYINDVQYDTEAEFLVAVDLYKANEIAELF